MTFKIKNERLLGAANRIGRSRVLPYLFAFFLAEFGLAVAFLLTRGRLSFLYETQAAGWYGLLRSLGRGNTLVALSEANDLAFLSFAFNPINRLLSLCSFSSTLLGVCLLNAIRCGLAAAAFTFFLKLRKTDDVPAVLFSVLYTLSAYSLVSQTTGIAADGLIVLPLLLAGIEMIVSRRGFALFAAALAATALISFRTLFGFLFFSLLWLFVSRCSRPDVSKKRILFDLGLFFAAIPIAFLISAPVLLPSFARFSFSFKGLAFKQSFYVIDFFGKMLPATYDGLSGNRFPYLCIGMIPLLLLPIFFISDKIATREKIACGVLFFVLWFTFSINVLSAFWDLFRSPDGFNYTVAVVFSALFLAMCARAFTYLERTSEKILAAAALIFVVLIALLQRLNLSYETAAGSSVVWFSDVYSVWISLPFLALGCAGLIAVIRARDAHPERPLRLLSWLAILLLLVTVFDVAVSDAALAGIAAEKEGVEVSKTEGNHAYASAYYRAYASEIEAVRANDPLYRTEKFDSKTADDALYLGYSSASSLPSDVLSAFGISYDENGVLKSVSSPLSLSLFGVRYVMTHEPIETKEKKKLQLKASTTKTDPTYDTPGAMPDSIGPIFSEVYKNEAGTVYENNFVLPVLFRTAAIPDGSVLTEVNASPYTRVNSVFRSLTGNPALSVYKPATIVTENHPYSKIVESPYPGYVAYERNSNNGTAALQYTVQVSRDGPLFCCFPTEYPLLIAEITVNGTSIGRAYTETETDQLDEDGNKIKVTAANAYYLGDFSEGDSVLVCLNFGSGSDGTVFYVPTGIDFIFEIDREATASAVAKLSSGTSEFTVKGDSVVASPSDKTELSAVVSTLSVSRTKVKGGNSSSFLGVFAAATTDGNGKVVLSPAISSGLKYAASLVGCLLLGFVLFCESLTEKGIETVSIFALSAGRELNPNGKERADRSKEIGKKRKQKIDSPKADTGKKAAKYPYNKNKKKKKKKK